MARILVIDDDRSLLELLSGYLERQAYDVTTAASGQLGLTIFADQGADLVILDVTMPGLDGWQVLARLREQSDVPIVMLTARSDEPEVLRGFSAGADDYVSKPFSFAQLVARVGAILDRAGRTSSDTQSVLKGADLEVDLDRHRVYRAGDPIDLTSTEFELLRVLMESRGHVLSREMLLRRLRGIDADIHDRSVDMLVSRVRKKLDDDSRSPRFIKTIRSAGYQFVGAVDGK